MTKIGHSFFERAGTYGVDDGGEAETKRVEWLCGPWWKRSGASLELRMGSLLRMPGGM